MERLQEIYKKIEAIDTGAVVLNTTGVINGTELVNPFNTVVVVFISSDAAWGAEAISEQLIRISGPDDETFEGLLVAFKPR